ncbi:MAG TPA: helix-hairpin-helix domain-containing protein [Thermoanaerobaculia bacterium]|nr:helix-hairpin-helix domain-containing protein [Thermoanaerobaculia bacterium]
MRSRMKILLFESALVLLSAVLCLPSAALAAKAKAAKIDLNTATQKELEDLPGVGEATAKKIIAGRPYSSVGDLEKAGVSKATIDKIRPLVTASKSSAKAAAPTAAPAVEPAKEKSAAKEKTGAKEKSAAAEPARAPAGVSKPVDLNTATQKELEDLPGVGEATAKKIIAGRPYSSVDDLAKAGVSKSTIGKIQSLVVVGAAPAASRPMAPAAKPAAAARPAPAEPSRAEQPASKPAPASQAQATSQPAPPVKGMVWVNTETKVFHREGDKWYGNTKHGKYMTEADALKAGYRESKQKPAAK